MYKKSSQETTKHILTLSSTQEKAINTYINSRVEKLIKPHFENFENEDIKLDTMKLIGELQDAIDNSVKKSGDIVSGTLQVLRKPQANMDVVNKEYVDWLFTTLSDKIALKFDKNYDLDLNHFKIKNLQTPTNINDAVTKNYVDEKFENYGYLQHYNHIFSKGQILGKKTFFFNPGFICPHKINIVSVGFSTSPYKYKIGEKTKIGEVNPTKLYFMINNEIKSEYIIEKNIQLGHILKEFEEPITFDKGDNLMMVVETILGDASVNISFF